MSYGKRPVDAPNWRHRMLREVTLDPARTHFLGRVPREQYLRVLQVSAAHVYLTYPFVLSWSLMEAMACGAPLIASDTAPVREVIRDGNGKLVDFFNVPALAEATSAVLSAPCAANHRRARARADASAYSHQRGIVGYERLLCGAVNGAGDISMKVSEFRGAMHELI